MNPTTAELRKWDRQHVWHAFTQMAEYEPFVVVAGEGNELIDIDGRRFLDGVCSIWCNVHGHRNPKLDRALRDQLDKVAHVTSLGMSNPPAIELSKRLTEVAPAGLQHVFFASDGSSAVEVAIKMALQYFRQRDNAPCVRSKYVAFGNAYHGDTLGSVSVGGVERFHAMFRPLLFDVIRQPMPDSYRLPEGVRADQLCAHHLGILESLLEDRHEEIAAIVVEPLMQCAAGMIRHPEGLLRGIREVTARHDVLLIADEVAVGFGRTGTLFACEQEQVQPDLLCLGKGLTGGYLPMSATLATTDIWNAFLGDYASSRTFYHGHTFGGNPLAAAVALASLELFETEDVLPRVRRNAEYLSRRLAESIGEHPNVGDIRQRGLIVGIELVRDRSTADPFNWEDRIGHRVCDAALEEGVWLRPLGNVVVLMPPLSIREDELDRIVTAVQHGLERVL